MENKYIFNFKASKFVSCDTTHYRKQPCRITSLPSTFIPWQTSPPNHTGQLNSWHIIVSKSERVTEIEMETSSATMILPEEPLLRSRPQESVSTTSLEPWRRPNRLAVILGRATGRRGPASEMMRERAASQLDVRRAEWGYSRPVVAIDMVWNLAFALAAVVVLSSTVNEKPNVPVRVWLIGYALQCIFHTVLVWVEYHRRNANLLDDTTADMSRNEDFGDGLGVESMAERMDRRFE